MNFWKRLFEHKQTSQSEAPQVTFRQRLSALRNIPKLFKLVWHTSPSLTIANILLRIIKSATPVAILYVGKLIIDQVVLLSHSNHSIAANHLWKLVAIEEHFVTHQIHTDRAVH